VKRSAISSEVARLAAPAARALDAAWRRMHWWIITMVVLYAVSGITIVKQDEVAVILRWGRLVGETSGLQAHGAGLLFAFPRPIDQVVRVQTKRVREILVLTLAPGAPPVSGEDEQDTSVTATGQQTLNPLIDGYAVTGDQNIVQVDMVARYRIRDPGEWAFYGPKPDNVLRTEVTAAMVRSLGEMGVDRVLSDGRKELIAAATRRAQVGLDAAHSGLELSSLELRFLGPPAAVAGDFSAVQSAFIRAETQKKDAQAFAESAVPQATATTDAATQAAHAAAASDLATALGDAEAFLALEREYRANPVVVRERLYRDAIEKALAASNVRWVPPPTGGTYKGMRVTVPPTGVPGPGASLRLPAGEP
jgi:membrane protease subunit HflK